MHACSQFFLQIIFLVDQANKLCRAQLISWRLIIIFVELMALKHVASTPSKAPRGYWCINMPNTPSKALRPGSLVLYCRPSGLLVVGPHELRSLVLYVCTRPS